MSASDATMSHAEPVDTPMGVRVEKSWAEQSLEREVKRQQQINKQLLMRIEQLERQHNEDGHRYELTLRMLEKIYGGIERLYQPTASSEFLRQICNAFNEWSPEVGSSFFVRKLKFLQFKWEFPEVE